MGDRVEERREAERILNAQIERQRTEAKVAAEKGKFDKVQAQASNKARSNTQQQRGKDSKQQARAGRALAARTGIDNGLTAMRQLGGDARMLRDRANQQAADKSAGAQTVAQLLANEKAGSAAHTGVPVAGKRPRDSGSEGREDNKQAKAGESTRGEQAVVAQGGASPLAPLAATAGKTGGAAGAGAVSPSTQQIIDEIVKRVHKGVINDDPFIHIQLQPNVLGGASLTMKLAKRGGGLSLNIDSSSKEATDLLSNGDNARALSQQLAARNISLTYLKVGQREVIR